MRTSPSFSGNGTPAAATTTEMSRGPPSRAAGGMEVIVPGRRRQDATGSPRRRRAMTQPGPHRQPPQHPKPPKLATERTSFNDKVANLIAMTVGSMWRFYGSIIGFATWAGLGSPSQATTIRSISCCSPSAASCSPPSTRRYHPHPGRGEHRAHRGDPQSPHQHERDLATDRPAHRLLKRRRFRA